jgi:N-acetyl-anhydromuramyl-L-alanine amidase AmpD
LTKKRTPGGGGAIETRPGAGDDVSGLAPNVNAELYYPEAKKNVGGEMRTRGRYRKNYPEGAVVHFTSRRDDPRGAISTALSDGYCYFVIAPNGDVYQNFLLNLWGQHAGRSSWSGLGNSLSQYLVGIELCNSGKLRKLPNGKFRPEYNEEGYLAKLKPPRKPDPAADLDASQVRKVKKKANQQAGWMKSSLKVRKSP